MPRGYSILQAVHGPCTALFAALFGCSLSLACANEPARAVMPESHRAFFNEYCVDCHGEKKQKGKVRLDDLAFSIDSHLQADRWQKILGAINSGDMPPDDAKQPEPNAKAEFLEALSNAMVVARKTLTDQGGQITMRRLNRREYKNTLRETLGVHVEVGALPSDGGSETFDTVGSSLFMSPDQFEIYRELGRKALDTAFEAAFTPPKIQKAHQEAELQITPGVERELARQVGIRKRYRQWQFAVDAAIRLPENQKVVAELKSKCKDAPDKIYLDWEKISGAASPKDFGFADAEDARTQNSRWEYYVPQGVDYLTQPHVKTGAYLGVRDLPHRSVHLQIPSEWPAGEYKVRVRIAATGKADPSRQFIDFISGQPANQILSSHNVTGSIETPQILEFPLQITKDGIRSFSISEKGIAGNADGKGPAAARFFEVYRANNVGPEYALWVDWIEAEGPFLLGRDQLALDSVRELLTQFEKGELSPAESINAFANRLLRGKAAGPEFLEKLTALYQARLNDGEKPREALKEPLSVLLASPSFLYLAEPAPDGKKRPVDALELASRLSFFLWSSPPDHELLSLARTGELNNAATLSAQVERLLKDPRSRKSFDSFVHQWLGLDRLDFFEFNNSLYPAFDLPTKAAARAEIVETFYRLLQEGDSIRRLLKSDSVYVNALLASYYGIPDVAGDEFRRVQLPKDSPRGGLLGMAAVHAMGSNGEQTSPVERGAWILRKLLHDPPPPPPANVPQLNRLAGKPLTTRERIALHQEDPQCTQCHRKIDPIGFALENFDAVGKWRTEDGRPGIPQNNRAINPAGAFHKGPAFRDFFELREIIANQPERLARGLIEAMVEYALGRPFGFSDEPLAEEILQKARTKDLAVSEFVHALVASSTFKTK